ncbi:PLP-dependent transferase [Candidatus Hodgkinia cicadicola]|uniref:Cystathionine beta-lyase n=1 Tax=Candidatus Hodgkinia cicadicola TaxID=573658 RepID=A0ABX4MGL7_9HYPH|nr:cystathionine beta-lyase [Candidatus Hodgkinia cicadicola]
MTNRIDYLNKIKTNTHNNLADSTTLIKTFDDMDNGFVNNILVNGSTILFRNTSEMIKNNKKYTYGTHGTPTTNDLCVAISMLERSDKTMVTCSGLMALTSTFLCILKPNDHALVVDSVYNPLKQFCKMLLTRFNVHVDFFDPRDEYNLKTLLRTNTKLIHLESPCSNTFEILDIHSICKYIKQRSNRCVISMDNSWATPLIYKPITQGVDISICALTKYPTGCSDVVIGSVSTTKKLSLAFNNFERLIGTTSSSYNCTLVLKNLKSVFVRLYYHHNSVVKVCKYLTTSGYVSHVFSPILPWSPDHKLWKRDYKLSNGIISFTLKSNKIEDYKRLLDGLKIFGLGWSWGGYKSLAAIADTKHRHFKGITNTPIIRLQIGFEDINDLINDLDNSFQHVNNKKT